MYRIVFYQRDASWGFEVYYNARLVFNTEDGFIDPHYQKIVRALYCIKGLLDMLQLD